MKHYQASRGWRNNNPLNIRRGEDWTGLCSKQTDSEFCQFMTMSMGYRAAVKILKSYARIFAQRGQTWSIDNVIRRWAPPSENQTDAYLSRVLQLMGIYWLFAEKFFQNLSFPLILYFHKDHCYTVFVKNDIFSLPTQ